MSINQKSQLVVIEGWGALPHVKIGVNVADEAKEPPRSDAAIDGLASRCSTSGTSPGRPC